ncbi:uncharacterized protein LOC133737569 [Rosa rugosa]|uniref:uncharacterized protein LOC133737569 n=1 Tax=Rosa rugosa TaxID=74645 RepID=UPI002B4186B9|nr:uncharacterized protein LOC133737569 [Rosa rugosa]
MNLLSWNCQGIGNPWTVRGVKWLISLNILKVVFLSETRCTDKEMDEIRRQVGMKSAFTVDCKFVMKKHDKGVSRAGGLCWMWAEDVTVEVQSYSDSHVDVDVVVGEATDPKRWRFTGFYGQPKVENRYLSWLLLRTLALQGNLLWVVGGDSNEITSISDKDEGVVRNVRQMAGLREALEFCRLKDVRYVGPKFTWTGVRSGHVIKIRLDRFVASQGWSDLFPASRVVHLLPNESDHLPVLLEVKEFVPRKKRKRKRKRFRFEEFWLREEECVNIVKQGWESGVGSHSVDRIRSKISKTRKALENCSSKDSQLESIVLDYFKGIFASSYPTDLQDIMAAIPTVITDEINSALVHEISEAEVYGALKQMHPSKAPGPDGFSPCFYHNFWSIVGHDVVAAVKCFLVSEELLRSMNGTFVTLIPKVKTPQYMSQLRPISLCNVLYKLGSKVLANRV